MKMNRMQVLTLVATGLFLSHTALSQVYASAQQAASSTQANQPGQQPSGTTSMQDSSNGPDMTTGMMRDRAFLHKATAAGLTEVQLGQLAEQKGSSDEIKSLGQKMADDHTEMNKQLAAIADSRGFRIAKKPGKEGEAEYTKLNSLSGDDFDKEYLTYLVRDHHMDLREFRIEATATTDSELHDAIMKAAMVVHDHMVLADKMARDKGIELPGRHQPPPSAQ